MNNVSQFSTKTGLMIAVTTALLFSIYPSCLRVVYADGGNAVFAVLATIGARALGLAIFCVVKRKPLFQTRETTKQGLIGGFLQALSSGCVVMAMSFLPGPLVVITVYTHTLMLLIFMAWKKEIKLDAVTITTTVAALIGISLVLDIWHKQPISNWFGIALAFAGAVAIVFRMYVYGRQTRERSPAVVGAENFIAAAFFSLPVLLMGMPHLPTSFTSLGWMALACTTMAIGSVIMFYGIALLGSFRWSLFLKLEPVFTALFSALLIGEILKPSQYAGMALVLGSLVIYQVVDHHRNKLSNRIT